MVETVENLYETANLVEKLKVENRSLRKKFGTFRNQLKKSTDEEINKKNDEIKRLNAEWIKSKTEAIESRYSLAACQQNVQKLHVQYKELLVEKEKLVQDMVQLRDTDPQLVNRQITESLKQSRLINDATIKMLKETEERAKKLEDENQRLRKEFENWRIQHKAHVMTIVAANEASIQTIDELRKEIALQQAANKQLTEKLAKVEGLFRQVSPPS